MKKIITLFYLIISCFIINNIPCASFSEKIDQKLQDSIQELIDDYKIPGAVVGVWIPGKGEWMGAFGYADKETKEKMTLDDHFRIGSITKTFVITGLLQLVDKGKVSLDDPISKYVKNVPNGDKITLRQLASMTSGLPSYTFNEKFRKEAFANRTRTYTPKELLEIAFSQPLRAEPGKEFFYNNTNTVLLGLVIEKVSGMGLDKYLEKNIFEPLKLTQTSFPSTATIPKPFAHGYSEQLSGKEEDVTDFNPSWGYAAGQMVSDLKDMKIWAKALGTGELLSKESFAKRLDWVTLPPATKNKKYGLGIGYDHGWLIHTGELPGYNSVVAYLPEEKAVFVCLVNSDVPVKKTEFTLEVEEGKNDDTLIKLMGVDEQSPVLPIYKTVKKILFTK